METHLAHFWMVQCGELILLRQFLRVEGNDPKPGQEPCRIRSIEVNGERCGDATELQVYSFAVPDGTRVLKEGNRIQRAGMVFTVIWPGNQFQRVSQQTEIDGLPVYCRSGHVDQRRRCVRAKAVKRIAEGWQWWVAEKVLSQAEAPG